MDAKDFVTYEQAIALKRLGFDSSCDYYYIESAYTTFDRDGETHMKGELICRFSKYFSNGHCIKAPTLEQAHKMDEEKYFWDECQVVLPDAGAAERYFNGNVPPDIIVGEKVRDIETGKILSIKVKNPEAIDGRWPLIMIDDLCDGGGTFVGLANAIREVRPDAVINIAVDHMVNPKGIENLSKNFNHVFFTNSYKDWNGLKAEYGKAVPALPENVTQINII